jgi:hypothetical protein
MKNYIQLIFACGLIILGILAACMDKWDAAGMVITGGFALLQPQMKKGEYP